MKSIEQQRKFWREHSRKDYWKHREASAKKIREHKRELRETIIRELGRKCVVCGVTEPLSIHHLEYRNRTRFSLKALRAGELVLLCRKHHRAIHYVNELIRAGHLEKILSLVNKEKSPWYS